MNKLPANLPENWLIEQTQLILNSYRKWTGKELAVLAHGHDQKSKLAQATELFYAPFVVVTSNNAADPLLNYGNKQALDLWEMPWEVLTQTPGRCTAEPMHRDQRQKFLNTVQKNGFIDNYAGIRISHTGKRFKIEKATVWNLLDERGTYLGQAATFSHWKCL